MERLEDVQLFVQRLEVALPVVGSYRQVFSGETTPTTGMGFETIVEALHLSLNLSLFLCGLRIPSMIKYLRADLT